MDQLFLKVINMSMTTSYVILLVILIRLLLKRVPKVYSYVLWIIVLFRLLVPFSVSSVFSMIPISTNPIPADIMYAAKPEIHSGITRIDRVVNNSLPTPVVATSVNPIQVWLLIGKYIWLAGMLTLLIYSVLSTLKLTKQLKSSKHLKGNIYIVNHIETPFVFGLLRPKIYLPFGLSEIEESYMIKHEETHIKRFDHIIKFISFIATAIHWFNPLVWLAFFLMSKDMELSCDEKVISEMGSGIKKDYSHSLLSLSSSKRIIGSSPLAFGGENTKGRIKNILNYKKPGFWATLVGIIAIGASVIGLLSNPKSNGLLVVQDEQLIKAFLENYYGQLSYTEEEQEDIEIEMAELSSIMSLDGEIKASSEKVKRNGFYYFYKETLTPGLYSAMVRNRKLPDLSMTRVGFEKSEITDLKLKKEKDTIHASFKLACYLEENRIEEKPIELDFVLKKIEGKIYIDSINGDLSYIPMGYENQISQLTYQIMNEKWIRFEKEMTDTWGIQLTATDVTSSGLTLVCKQSGGQPTGDLQTGSYFFLEQHIDNEWLPVEMLSLEHELGWTDEAWTIPMDDTAQWDVDWSWLYGELPVGYYRIGKEITDFRDTGDYDESSYYANFEVTN